MFKVTDSHGITKYQAVFLGESVELMPFTYTDMDEMEKIYLWELKEDIGYVDECNK